MRDAHRRVGLVDVLSAGPARAHRVDADVLGLDVDVDLLGLRQHGDSGRAGVDAATRPGPWHPLPAITARPELAPGEPPPAGDPSDDLLVAAERVLGGGDDLHLPAVLLGIAAVHAEQVGGEQCRLVAPGAGAHLQDGALLV